MAAEDGVIKKRSCQAHERNIVSVGANVNVSKGHTDSIIQTLDHEFAVAVRLHLTDVFFHRDGNSVASTEIHRLLGGMHDTILWGLVFARCPNTFYAGRA
jgi:hypothetical protein